MKLKYNFLLLVFFLSANSVFAQYAEDALRFSETEQGATARLRALGSAQNALGGDISSLSGNPAGLGFFTRSDISLTTDFTNSKVRGLYLGASTDTQKDKLGLTYLGAVWHRTVRKPKGADLNSGWLGFNFGLSYNKTNNFNSTVEYGGNNPTNSYADYLADISDPYLKNGDQKALPAGSLQDMAYQSFLIEYDPAGYFPTTELNSSQRNSTFHSGSQSEVNLAFGGNYSNKLYVGASLGLSSINYNADREFNEGGNNRTFTGQDPWFINGKYSLSYLSSQVTEGAGLNLKAGLIYRPVSNVRLGFNFLSPTWYSIDDSFAETIETRYRKADGTTIEPYTFDDDVFNYSYRLRTPYKLNGGLAIISGAGLITGDVEYVDYSTMHFSSDNSEDNRNINQDIRNNYDDALNFRVGGELKLSSVYLRAGFNSVGNPYLNAKATRNIYSAGLGYRINNFYIDGTYSNTTFKYSASPYKISSDYPDYSKTGAGETATIKNQMGRVFLTVGTRF